MRRFRNGMILVLAAVVIVLCAVLPQIAIEIQDSLTDQKVIYEDIKTVQLDKELTNVEKLFLLRDGLRVSVSEEKMSTTKEEIKAIAYAQYDEYLSMGLISDYPGIGEVTAEPMVFLTSDSLDTSGFFWEVQMKPDPEYDGERQYGNRTFWIDDQTGAVLLVDCQAEFFYDDNMDNYLTIFVESYLANLDLVEGLEMTEVQENVETKKGGTNANLFIRDKVYGELNFYFMVYENGFFVTVS